MDQPKTATPDNGSPEDLATDYANNTAFEATVWDLKLVFGEFSQRANAIDWHTSITVPWAHAKLISYYLQINIEAHELQQGKINFPPTMIPPPPLPPETSDEKTLAVFKMVQQHRERFIESLK